MVMFTCVLCNEEKLKPTAKTSENQLCTGCDAEIQHQLNEIDRNTKPHQKRKEVIKFLSHIPEKALSETHKKMAEEIADPDLNHRTECVGRLGEIELGENGIQRK